MPFGALERPSLALGPPPGALPAARRACETRYLGIPFAERVGVERVPLAASATSRTPPSPASGCSARRCTARPDAGRRLRRRGPPADVAAPRRRHRPAAGALRAAVEPFLDHCLETIDWSPTTRSSASPPTFQQNIASLALAARVKAASARHHRSRSAARTGKRPWAWRCIGAFPFVDLVFSGEADAVVPRRARAPATGSGVDGIRGVASRGAAAGGRAAPPAAPIDDLDVVPVPDFDALLRPAAREPSVAGDRADPARRDGARLLVGRALALHLLRPERRDDGVPQQVARARARGDRACCTRRYGVATFSVVDDILDMRYFKTVLPDARRGRASASSFFWEVKANLTAEHVRAARATPA